MGHDWVNYLLNNTVKGGTPAKLMGYKLVTELPGSGPLIIIEKPIRELICNWLFNMNIFINLLNAA